MGHRSHRDLIVWQKAISLARETYYLTAKLPAHERFGLTGQMRAAVVSIAGNVAEGSGRSTRGDYARFISIARGSARELETHFELLLVLGLVEKEELAIALSLLDEVSRMLTAMLRKLAPLKP